MPAKSLTSELSTKICETIETGNYLETAAACAGITAVTVRNWVRRGRKDIRAGRDSEHAIFVRAFDAAQAEAEKRLVNGIYLAGRGHQSPIDPGKWVPGDWRALLVILERRFPDRWCQKINARVEEEQQEFLGTLKQNLDELTYQRVVRAAEGMPARETRGEDAGDLAERAAKIYGIGAALAAGTSTGEK